jgi:hypothetical protein
MVYRAAAEIFLGMVAMSIQDQTHMQTYTEGTIEACLDELNELVATLDRYPPTVIAVAMSLHLQSLLRALLECDLCSRQQVRELVEDLESEVFEEVEV